MSSGTYSAAGGSLRLSNLGQGNLYLATNGVDAVRVFKDQGVQIGGISTSSSTSTARLLIKGSGSTSATTSLLVQNSAGTLGLSVTDDLVTTTGGTFFNICSGGTVSSFRLQNSGNTLLMGIDNNHDIGFNGFYSQRAPGGYRSSFQDTGASSSLVASAVVSITSTTRGFLPPRMTTAQKNAIGTPAAGLMVYDTTLNKLCVYTTAWETITSL